MAHAIVLCLCALALLGAMPFAFFRRGRLTAGWLLTALPFLLMAAVLLSGLGGALVPAQLPAALAESLTFISVPLCAAAIGMIALTIGVHRAPVSMWHQADDQPLVLLTTGPYAYVRHPFYTAFILMLAGCLAAFPHVATALLAVLGAVQLNRTAAREERRLLGSELRVDYARYMARTRRFLPVRRRAEAAAEEGVIPRRARARNRPARPASTRRAS